MQSSKTASRRAHSSFRLQKAIFSNNLQRKKRFSFGSFFLDKTKKMNWGPGRSHGRHEVHMFNLKGEGLRVKGESVTRLNN